MISNTLSSAAADLEEWLRQQPNAYAHVEADIKRLCAEMDRIRLILDTPSWAEASSLSTMDAVWAGVRAKVKP